MWRRRVRAGDVRYGCTPIPGRLEYRDLESATQRRLEARVTRVATQSRAPSGHPTGPAPPSVLGRKLVKGLNVSSAEPRSVRGPVRSGPASRAAGFKTVTVRRGHGRGSTLYGAVIRHYHSEIE